MFSLDQHAASSRSYEFSWHAAALRRPYHPLLQGRSGLAAQLSLLDARRRRAATRNMPPVRIPYNQVLPIVPQ